MELNHLRVFFEVAKAGGFSEAAKRLNISQSALSRSVALLEESEDVRLFERSKRGVRLTAIGGEVFRHCEELFQTVSRISSICRSALETCEGPLRFAAADHVVNYLLPEPLQGFRDEFPAVIPSITLGTPDEILEKLLLTDCEFTLAFARVSAPQVEFEALREERMALVVQGTLWRRLGGAKLAKIVETVGYISSVGAHAQSRPSRVLRELFGKMPPVSFEVNGQEAQKRICLAGGGVAYLQRFMVAREIEQGLLHEINVEAAHAFKLWLATRRGHELSVPARTFLQRLRQSFKAPQG